MEDILKSIKVHAFQKPFYQIWHMNRKKGLRKCFEIAPSSPNDREEGIESINALSKGFQEPNLQGNQVSSVIPS